MSRSLRLATLVVANSAPSSGSLVKRTLGLLANSGRLVMQYQEHKHKLPDSHFRPGEICFLLEGNKGRYLDDRRTPGEIIKIDAIHSYFYWKVTDFEDKGAIWEMDFNEIANFQFEKCARLLNESEKERYIEISKINNEKITISKSGESIIETNKRIENEIERLMTKDYFRGLPSNDLSELYDCRQCIQKLLKKYLLENGISEIDKTVSSMIVSNPYSGELLKHLWHNLAEMGFVDFENTKLRYLDSIPSVDDLTRYIIKRIAFVRCMFLACKIDTIITYRGINSSYKWLTFPKAFSSWTFEYEVARDLAKIESNADFEVAYIMKRKTKIDEVFMTSIETSYMNKQYDEKEVLLFCNYVDGIF